jgi:hypothetical protein
MFWLALKLYSCGSLSQSIKPTGPEIIIIRMSVVKRNCTSEASVSCSKCNKKGRSRVMKAHMLLAHGTQSEYCCVLPTSEGVICGWSCGMKLSCFNAHQRVIHGVSFAAGAKHVYTLVTGFLLKDVINVSGKGHSAVCLAGSKAQADLVMEEGRDRYRLRNDLVGMEVVDFETTEKVLLGGRWFMLDGVREIVLREDGSYVVKQAGKRKRSAKTTIPAKRVKVHNQTTHSVCGAAPSDVFFEGEISSSIEQVVDVDVPVVFVSGQSPAEVAHKEDNASAEIVRLLEEIIPTKIVREETLTPTEMVRGEPNTHAGLVNEELVAGGCVDDSEEEFIDYDYEAYDDDNSNMEVEGVRDVMVTSVGSVAGNPGGDSYVDTEGEIDLRFGKVVRSILLTKIPNAKNAIAMHKLEIGKLEEEIKGWERVINIDQ